MTTDKDNGRTHWQECWRDRQHHACAVAQVELWQARYMAAHDVLLAVEAYIEAMDGRGYQFGEAGSYSQMRAAFLAYRAAIEAGAPLGWAVAGEQQRLPDAEAQRAQRFAEEWQK